MATSTLLQSMSSLPDELPTFKHLDERYKCIICQNVLRVPMMTQCGHRMCNSCALKHLDKEGGESAHCPGGLEDCVSYSSKPGSLLPDFGTHREIMRLDVICPYSKFGCKEILPWSKIRDHETSCMYALEECVNRGFGCKAKVSKALMAKHVKDECEFKTLLCPHCEVRVLQKLLQEHIDNACPSVSIICPFKCGEQSIQRGQLDEHRATCRAKPSECKYKLMGCRFSGSEAQVHTHEAQDTNRHLELFLTRITTLEMDNAELRNKVQNLEGSAGASSGNKALDRTTAEEIENFVKAVQDKNDSQIMIALKKIAELQDKVQSVENKRGNQKELSTLKDSFKAVERSVDELKQKDNNTGMSEESKTQIVQMERTLGVLNMRLQEMDLRLQCVETASYDGILVWKIRDYKRRKQEAVSGRTVSLYSQPFYTSRYGYKACARIYLNGDGMGKGTHISLFFVILRGDFDALLPWPFRQKVTMMLLDQDGGKKNIIDNFRADPTSNSFKRPTSDMNIASGCPLFAAQSVVDSSPFMKDDCIFLKIQVDTSELKDASGMDSRSGSYT